MYLKEFAVFIKSMLWHSYTNFLWLCSRVWNFWDSPDGNWITNAFFFSPQRIVCSQSDIRLSFRPCLTGSLIPHNLPAPPTSHLDLDLPQAGSEMPCYNCPTAEHPTLHPQANSLFKTPALFSLPDSSSALTLHTLLLFFHSFLSFPNSYKQQWKYFQSSCQKIYSTSNLVCKYEFVGLTYLSTRGQREGWGCVHVVVWDGGM